MNIYHLQFFSVGLNKLDQITLNLPSELELEDITEGNNRLYNEINENILSCKLCNFYVTYANGGVPDSRPF